MAWTHHNGPIPDGMTVHHECFTRACVNPSHLALMSNVANARRQRGSDWDGDGCEYGHPESARKLYGKKKPVWRCGDCIDQMNLLNAERQKAERKANAA